MTLLTLMTLLTPLTLLTLLTPLTLMTLLTPLTPMTPLTLMTLLTLLAPLAPLTPLTPLPPPRSASPSAAGRTACPGSPASGGTGWGRRPLTSACTSAAEVRGGHGTGREAGLHGPKDTAPGHRTWTAYLALQLRLPLGPLSLRGRRSTWLCSCSASLACRVSRVSGSSEYRLTLISFLPSSWYFTCRRRKRHAGDHLAGRDPALTWRAVTPPSPG
ncbi:hypothetical protein EYF80_019872 [Liparis tanakae]|uniref:Uncharacterized protein n=1 Tax=Liparis tanakae TaxID=230148 RepID=A0A4Z2HVY1_9TELE|nr:hypothetical protein EYF80_019872 [Liparis tanakae]